MCEDRVVGLAPLRLLGLEPECGPLDGGTRLHVDGDALVEARGKTKARPAPRPVTPLRAPVTRRLRAGYTTRGRRSGLTLGRGGGQVRFVFAGGAGGGAGGGAEDVRVVRGAYDAETGRVVCDTPKVDRFGPRYK